MTVKAYPNGTYKDYGGNLVPPAPDATGSSCLIVLSPAFANPLTIDLTAYTAYPFVGVDVGQLTGNTTFNITNGTNRQIIRVRFETDGTPRTLTQGAAIRASMDVPWFTAALSSGSVHRCAFEWDGADSVADLVAIVKGY